MPEHTFRDSWPLGDDWPKPSAEPATLTWEHIQQGLKKLEEMDQRNRERRAKMRYLSNEEMDVLTTHYGAEQASNLANWVHYAQRTPIHPKRYEWLMNKLAVLR